MPDRSPLHPRLRAPGAVRELAARWRAELSVRIERLLDPGLAAELAVVLRGLPLAPVGDDASVCWQVTVEVPDEPDPQHPACLFRLVEVQRGLPELIEAITGERWTVPTPRQIVVRSFRMGSFADPGARPHAVIGLTGARWPATYGGHADRAPGWDTLDLARAAPAVALITRPVETLEVAVPVEAG